MTRRREGGGRTAVVDKVVVWGVALLVEVLVGVGVDGVDEVAGIALG